MYMIRVKNLMIIISHSEIDIGKKNKVNRADGEGKLIGERQTEGKGE